MSIHGFSSSLIPHTIMPGMIEISSHEEDTQKHSLISLIPYDLSAQNADKGLKIYLFYLNSFEKAFEALNKDDFIQLDALVGENACHVRAIWLALRGKECLKNSPEILKHIAHTKNIIEHILIKDDFLKKISSQEFFNNNKQLLIELSFNEYFVLLCYILTLTKLIIDPAETPLHRMEVANPDAITEQGLSPHNARKIIKLCRKQLSELSVHFMRKEAAFLPEKELSLMVSEEYSNFNAESKTTSVSFFWSCRIVTSIAVKYEIPIVLRCWQRHPDKIYKYNEGERYLSIFLKVINNTYQEFQPDKNDLKKVAMVVEGITFIVKKNPPENKAWKELILSVNVIDYMQINAAAHNQFIDPTKVYLIENAPTQHIYNSYKNRIPEIDCALENQRNLFINHAYAATIESISLYNDFEKVPENTLVEDTSHNLEDASVFFGREIKENSSVPISSRGVKQYDEIKRNYLISTLLPFKPQNQKNIEVGLHEYRFFLTALKEAFDAVEKNNFKALDAIVGENACHIRAIWAVLRARKCLENATSTLYNIDKALEKIKALIEKSDFKKGSTFQDLLNKHDDLDIKLSFDELFLLQCYILTLIKKEKDPLPELPLQRNDVADDRIMRKYGISTKNCNHIVHFLRKSLSEDSAIYMRQQASLLKDIELILMISQLYKTKTTGPERTSISCFWSYKIVTQLALKNDVPIILRCWQRMPGKNYKNGEGEKYLSIFFTAINGKYSEFKTERSDLSRIALVVEGITYRKEAELPSIEEWKRQILSHDVIDYMLINSAGHRQFVDSTNDPIIENAPTRNVYQDYKDKAKEIGCSQVNPELFFINHVFANTIANFLEAERNKSCYTNMFNSLLTDIKIEDNKLLEIYHV